MPQKYEADPIATMPTAMYAGESGLNEKYYHLLERANPFDSLWHAYQDISSGEGLHFAAMADLGRYPKLSPEQNVELGRYIIDLRGEIDLYARDIAVHLPQVRDGHGQLDDKLQSLFTQLHYASSVLALGNCRLIMSCLIARENALNLTTQDLEDLFQEGWNGLIDAAKRYDPWHGRIGPKITLTANAFSSYAVPYIEGHMKNATQKIIGPFTLPRYSVDDAIRYGRSRRHLITIGYDPTHEDTVIYTQLAHLLQREPTLDEVTEQIRILQANGKLRHSFNLLCRRITDTLNAMDTTGISDTRYVPYRDAFGDVGSVEVDSEELIQSPRSSAVEDDARREILQTKVSEAISTIPPKEQLILQFLFGLPPYDKDHTLQKTANEFGTSLNTVIELRNRALRHLRHPTLKLRHLLE